MLGARRVTISCRQQLLPSLGGLMVGSTNPSNCFALRFFSGPVYTPPEPSKLAKSDPSIVEFELPNGVNCPSTPKGKTEHYLTFLRSLRKHAEEQPKKVRLVSVNRHLGTVDPAFTSPNVLLTKEEIAGLALASHYQSRVGRGVHNLKSTEFSQLEKELLDIVSGGDGGGTGVTDTEAAVKKNASTVDAPVTVSEKASAAGEAKPEASTPTTPKPAPSWLQTLTFGLKVTTAILTVLIGGSWYWYTHIATAEQRIAFSFLAPRIAPLVLFVLARRAFQVMIARYAATFVVLMTIAAVLHPRNSLVPLFFLWVSFGGTSSSFQEAIPAWMMKADVTQLWPSSSSFPSLSSLTSFGAQQQQGRVVTHATQTA